MSDHEYEFASDESAEEEDRVLGRPSLYMHGILENYAELCAHPMNREYAEERLRVLFVASLFLSDGGDMERPDGSSFLQFVEEQVQAVLLWASTNPGQVSPSIALYADRIQDNIEGHVDGAMRQVSARLREVYEREGLRGMHAVSDEVMAECNRVDEECQGKCILCLEKDPERFCGACNHDHVVCGTCRERLTHCPLCRGAK